jgi:hypothetical protein
MLDKIGVLMMGAALLCAGSALAQSAGQSKAQADLAAEVQKSPFSAPTVAVFISDCPSDKSGCSSVVGSVLITSQLNNTICLPGSSDDYTKAVIDWLTTHQEAAAMKTKDGIMLALKTVYKC